MVDPIWEDRSYSADDVRLFVLYNRHVLALNYTKAIFFCSRQLRPAFGPFSVVYTMQDRPCTGNWRQQYYLYGAPDPQYSDVGDLLTTPFYVGMSVVRPHHSRITFNGFAENYEHSTRFIVHAISPFSPPIPTTTILTPSTTPRPPLVISSCQREDPIFVSNPVTITSPNYPNEYENQQRCQWIVTLSERDRRNPGIDNTLNKKNLSVCKKMSKMLLK